MKATTVVLNQTKETKTTFRFDADAPDAVVTSVYVKKQAFEGAPVPRQISLRIEPAG